MNDAELLRYSRHILLPQIGIEGQLRLRAAHALIVGLGGLGSPVALYLAASGFGRLSLVDDDRVDRTNLQRQIAHADARVGMAKVESAAIAARALNPGVDIVTHNTRVDAESLGNLVAAADVVIDASDNFATRFALNAACVAARKPLVSAAAIRLEAQISVFDARDPASPCYRCLYTDADEIQETCSQTGVLAPLVGVIGSMQALEAIKLVAGFGHSLVGRLLLFDAELGDWRSVRLRKDPACPICRIA